MSKFYITTPIYYVNDVPHIGHAYTTVVSDVLARFARIDGRDVYFLTGTDEHGQKVEKSAVAKGLSPQEFTDNMSVPFRNLCSLLNVSNDDFIRTSEERHKNAARFFWKKLEENGHIYKGKYSGWYSVRDEAFYAESEIKDGVAPSGAPVEWMEEESYFFDLSKWQDKLLDFYEKNPDFIKPQSRRNEVISFVKSGLNDLSISRTTMKWGIPVPGDESHVMYVWLDALTNYISALGYPENTENMEKFWPADVHMVGKDILRFHAVYWPAFLMAAGITLPKRVFAHGWWTNNGEKISKSLGNVIDPVKIINQYGVDYFRYYMMREVILGNDGNFSNETFIMRINSELANKIGNLSQRTLSFIFKNLGGELPSIQDNDFVNSSENLTEAYESINLFRKNIENQDINSYLSGVIKIAENANNFIDKEAPWALRKTDEQRMKDVLYILVEIIKCLGIYLLPVIPDLATQMLNQLNIPLEDRIFSRLSKPLANTVINSPEPIFARLED
jgi:methionyl-tRNA synthetase